MRIIYPNPDGGISVIHPTGELPTEQVALKDVPHGLPFLIVEDDALPTDRTFRAAWEADFSEPHGTGMGPHRWFIQQAEDELASIAARVAPVEPEAIPVVPFDEVPFADDLTPEERQARYSGYVADVEAHNAAQAARYAKTLSIWQDQQQADAAQCNDLIARMKAEVLSIEGVTL